MIRREIVLPAPREEVWEALTDFHHLGPDLQKGRQIAVLDPLR